MNQPENTPKERRYIVREQKLPPSNSRYTHDTAKGNMATYNGQYELLPVWDEVPELFTYEEAIQELQEQAMAFFQEKDNVEYIGAMREWLCPWDPEDDSKLDSDEMEEIMRKPNSIEWDGPGYYSIDGACLYADGSEGMSDGDCLRIYVCEVEAVPHKSANLNPDGSERPYPDEDEDGFLEYSYYYELKAV